MICHDLRLLSKVNTNFVKLLSDFVRLVCGYGVLSKLLYHQHTVADNVSELLIVPGVYKLVNIYP